MGGWTSILAACGDQDIFKASLSHDPSHVHYQKEVMEDKFVMKRPTCIVHSSSFLNVMCAEGFGFGKAAREGYLKYANKFAETIPNSKHNF